MIAEKIEHVLQTWAGHIEAGELPLHVYDLGCERIRDAARQLRNMTAAVDGGRLGCPVLAENIAAIHCGRSQASRSSDPLSKAMRDRCPSCPNAAGGADAYATANALSGRIEATLDRWGKRPDMVAFVMGCCAIREAAAEVRAIEETEVPADIADMDMEALQRHFADLMDPSPSAARLRD